MDLTATGLPLQLAAVEAAQAGVRPTLTEWLALPADQRAALADASLALRKELALDIAHSDPIELLHYVDPETADEADEAAWLNELVAAI